MCVFKRLGGKHTEPYIRDIGYYGSYSHVCTPVWVHAQRWGRPYCKITRYGSSHRVLEMELRIRRCFCSFFPPFFTRHAVHFQSPKNTNSTTAGFQSHTHTHIARGKGLLYFTAEAYRSHKSVMGHSIGVGHNLCVCVLVNMYASVYVCVCVCVSGRECVWL